MSARTPRSTGRKILLGVVALLTVVVVAGGVGIFTLYQSMRVRPADMPAPLALSRAERKEASSAMDTKVSDAMQQVKQAASKGEVREVQVTVSNSELNAKAQEKVEQIFQASKPASGSQSADTATSTASVDVKDVAIRVADGGVTVAAVTKVGGQEVPVQARVQLEAVNGKVSVDVDSLKAGAVEVPPAVREELLARAKSAVGGDLSAIDLGVPVKSIKVVDGRLEIDMASK